MPLCMIAATGLLLMGGCSWIGGEDERDSYLSAEEIPRTTIPAHLDQPDFQDLLRIPEVNDARGLAGRKIELGLPEPLSTNVGVERIVIRRLGDQRWVFLDAPPAIIWPQVLGYWEQNNFSVERADPRSGIIESGWIASVDGTPEQILDSIRGGGAGSRASIQNRFQLRIEPGVRDGSSEIHLTHREAPLMAARVGELDWSGTSDDEELEGELLRALAFALGDTINSNQAVSLLATGNRKSRVELVPDVSRPVLKYQLDFDRTWATVNAALETARITIDDLDRTSANFFVTYSEAARKEPGFFTRLFSKERVEGGSRYLVHLENQPGEVHVTVKLDENTLADSLVAERILRLIKEYST